jgi:hypothetical protein
MVGMSEPHIIVFLGYDTATIRAVYKKALDARSCRTGLEFPEANLHPRDHAALVEPLVKRHLSGPYGLNYIATHSETITLQLRLRIADGTINHEEVVFIWLGEVGDIPLKITFDRYGEVSEWPKGVFMEDFQIVKAMRRAQVAKGIDTDPAYQRARS